MSDTTLIDPTASLSRQSAIAGTPGQAAGFDRQRTHIPLTDGRVRPVHGRLTRKGMVDVINSGQSVMMDGNSLAVLGDLPSEDTLAIESGNKAEVDARIKAKNDELAKVRAELDTLKAAQAKPGPAATPQAVTAEVDQAPVDAAKGKGNAAK